MQSKVALRVGRLVGSFCLVMTIWGCQETISFNVLRAAKVNVRGMTPEGQDATVSVGNWEGVDSFAAGDIGQRVRELVTNAPGGVVKFAETGGIVRLDGNLREYKYEESVTQENQKCTTYNAKTKKTEEYACTVYTRAGSARIAVSMNVIDEQGKTVGADSYADSVARSTTATDAQPPGIDWESEMGSLRTGAAMRLAALVVPIHVAENREWFDCGDADDKCAAGLVQLRQSNIGPAQVLFRQAVADLDADPDKDQEALAAAWWALTLSQEFSGDYAGATASLEQCIALAPANEVFAAETKSIQDLRQNSEKLGKQGGDEE